MTPIDDTNNANTHVAGLGKFARCIFIYWVTTLAVATLVTGTFVTFMGFIRDIVSR